MQKILVTGTAGFIGFHLTTRLVKEGYEVIGLDIINDYYDINLKYSRLKFLGINKDQILLNQKVSSVVHSNLKFIQSDLADHEYIIEMMRSESFDYVIAFWKEINKSLVITRSDKGSVVINHNDIFECESQKNLKIVDLTGAGDLFAAGFLNGYINRMSLRDSLYKGTEMASKIIQQIGARIN